jgi:predicted metal-dependent hydrolase
VQLHLPFLQSAEPPLDPAPARPVAPLDAIEFVRVSRARRYILRVRPDGTLRVTVPRGGSRREAEQFVRRHEKWVIRERGRIRDEGSLVASREWHDGRTILVGGEALRMSVEPGASGWRVGYGDRSVHVRERADVKAAVERDLRELARSVLLPRLSDLAAQYSLRVGAVSIRNQRSRWGSCARNGNIALNFRLVQMPPQVRDYVLVHELMHLKQQNHSRRFWRLIEAACPEFRDAERWLKTAGRELF